MHCGAMLLFLKYGTGDQRSSRKEFSTSLDKKNNTEGLAYDPVSGDLLIACKKESGR